MQDHGPGCYHVAAQHVCIIPRIGTYCVLRITYACYVWGNCVRTVPCNVAPDTVSHLHNITNVVSQVDSVGSGVVCGQKRFQRGSLQVGVPPCQVCHDFVLHVDPPPLGMFQEAQRQLWKHWLCTHSNISLAYQDRVTRSRDSLARVLHAHQW